MNEWQKGSNCFYRNRVHIVYHAESYIPKKLTTLLYKLIVNNTQFERVNSNQGR